MQWFRNRQTEELICMETTMLSGIRIQTVLDTGFFLTHKQRDPKAHDHLNYELYVMESGTCTAQCNETVFSCEAGDLLFIPIGTAHHVRTLSEDALLYSLRFSCQGFPLPEHPLPIHSPQMLTLLQQIRRELAHLQPFAPEKFQGLLQAFYAEFLRMLGDPKPNISDPVTPSIVFTPDRIRKLPGYQASIPQEYYIDMLDEFFTHLPPETATLTELAGRLHLSISQTKRMIKAKYGISFQQKLIQSRIEYSMHLMHTTTLSLEQIAERVGYRSYNTFFDTFCAQVGQTPSQYRKERG